MPRNTGIEDFDDRELTRTTTGDRLSTGLPAITGTQGLPSASRSPIRMVMPSLASHIWQWLDHIREKSSRLAEWVTNHVGAGFTSSRVSRLPIISPLFIPTLSKPAIPSPMSQRLVDLLWFRRHRKRKNESPQRLSVADDGQFVDYQSTGTDEPQPGELLQPFRATEGEHVADAADKLYPIGIKNLLSPPLGITEPPDFFPQTHAISGHLLDEQVADSPEPEDISWSAPPPISSISKISSTYQTNKIHKLSCLHVKDAEDGLAQANWRPQHTYQSQWSDKVWAPLIQRLGLSRVPIKGPPRIIRQITHSTYATPVRPRLHLTDTQERAKPDGQAAQQLTLPYPINNIANTPEVMTLGEEATDIPRATRSLKELVVFKSLLPKPPISSKDLGVLATKVTSQRAPEISQSEWSVPLANQLPELVGQKAEVTNISEKSDSMTHSQVKVTPAKTDSVSLNQQEGQVEKPPVLREFPSVTSLRHQPPSITGLQRQLSFITESIYQPISPAQQYFKSPGEIPLPDRIENHRFVENQDYGLSTLRYEDTRLPALELLPASVGGSRLGSNATGSEGSLPAVFEGTAYYGGQIIPELALAPAGLPAEAVPPPPTEPEVKADETTQEVAALDLEAIARDVYNIIKLWLGEETEWA